MKIFNINWNRLARLLLPTFLRKATIQAFLYACLKPLKSLYSVFLAERQDNLYRAGITPQIRLLESLLNKVFPSIVGAWAIQDGELRDPPYLYNESENRQKYIYTTVEDQPKFLYKKSEIGFKDASFYILIPIDKNNAETLAEVTALINDFKLPGRTWRFI